MPTTTDPQQTLAKRSSGVAIYKNDSAIHLTMSPVRPKFEEDTAARSRVGDVCVSHITFMGVKAALASVYVTPGSSQNDIKRCLSIFLVSYSPIVSIPHCDTVKEQIMPMITQEIST